MPDESGSIMREITPEEEQFLREHTKPVTKEDEDRISTALADLKEHHRALGEGKV